MSKTAAAPGTSINAQLREERAKLRRAARKKISELERTIKIFTDRLDEAKRELKELEDRLRGRSPEITFTEESNAKSKE